MPIPYDDVEYFDHRAAPAGHTARDMALVGRVDALESGGTVDLTAIQNQLDAQAAVDAAQEAVDVANKAVDDAQTAAIANKEDVGVAATLDAALQAQITANDMLNAAQQTAITANIAAIAALQASIVKPDYEAAESDAAGILNKPDLTQSETYNVAKAAASEYVKGVSRILWNGYQYILNTDAVLQAARGNTASVDQTVLPSDGDGSDSSDWVILNPEQVKKRGMLTFSQALNGSHTGFDLVATAYHHIIIYGGSAEYYRDGSTGTPTTGDECKFFDVNGDGFSLVKENLNVRMFGAKGYDASDDTLNIQRAMDCVQSVGGGSLGFPMGRYMVTGLVAGEVYGNAPILFTGDNRVTSVIEMTEDSGIALSILPDNCTISDIRFVGTGSGTATGIELADGTSGPKYSTLKEVTVTDFAGDGVRNNGFANEYHNLVVQRCGNGYTDYGNGGSLTFYGGFIANCDVGMNIIGSVRHMRVADTNIENNLTGFFGSGSSSSPNQLIFQNVHFEGNVNKDVRLGSGTSDVLFDHCRLGGIGAHTDQAISHVGGAAGRNRIRINGSTFISKTDTTNTEVISVTNGCDLIIDAPDGKIQGVEWENISIGTNSLCHVSGQGYQELDHAADSALTVDFELGGFIEITLGANITVLRSEDIWPNQDYYINFIQSGAGGFTVGYGTDFANGQPVNTTGQTLRHYKGSSAGKLVEVG